MEAESKQREYRVEEGAYFALMVESIYRAIAAGQLEEAGRMEAHLRRYVPEFVVESNAPAVHGIS